MTGPRVWISPTASARAMRVGSTRHRVEPRVSEARRTAVAWAAAAQQSGLGCAEQDGETARAGARSTETKVAAMADSPRPSRDVDEVPTQFAAVPLQVEPGNPYLQRLDAQAAVDLARQHHLAARRALVTATEDGAPGSVATRAVAATADDARATLRTAVGVLRSLTTLHRVDVSATIELEVQVDGPLMVIRPSGELDLFTSPHLERACVDRLDAARVDRMVVDLSAVTFLDSSGLAVLVEIRRTCLEGGTTFALTGLRDRSRRLLAITRLDTVFDVV